MLKSEKQYKTEYLVFSLISLPILVQFPFALELNETITVFILIISLKYKSRFVELIIPPQFGMVNYVTLKSMKEVLPYEVPPSRVLQYGDKVSFIQRFSFISASDRP